MQRTSTQSMTHRCHPPSGCVPGSLVLDEESGGAVDTHSERILDSSQNRDERAPLASRLTVRCSMLSSEGLFALDLP